MAIKKVHLPDGTEIAIDEWLHWPQYSVIEFAAAVGVNLRAFTYVQGQRVPAQGIAPRNATRSDTNQVARARMNHDEAYLAYSITYEPFALTDSEITASPQNLLQAPAPILEATNLRRLQRDLVIELLIGAGIRKPQFRAPFAYIGQGIGAPAWTSGDAVAGAINFSYGSGGHINPRNQRHWKLPIYIQSDRVMSLSIRSLFGPIAGLDQNVQLRWWLDGLKRRPVA